MFIKHNDTCYLHLVSDFLLVLFQLPLCLLQLDIKRCRFHLFRILKTFKFLYTAKLFSCLRDKAHSLESKIWNMNFTIFLEGTPSFLLHYLTRDLHRRPGLYNRVSLSSQTSEHNNTKNPSPSSDSDKAMCNLDIRHRSHTHTHKFIRLDTSSLGWWQLILMGCYQFYLTQAVLKLKYFLLLSDA